MVIDQRDYERLSGRRGDPNERLAVAQTKLDERHGQNAEQLHRAQIARGLTFRGLGGWPALLSLHPKGTALGVVIFILVVLALTRL